MAGNGPVLLVEDDPNDAILIGRSLKVTHPATRLITLSDGQQAVDYLAGRGVYRDRDQYPLPLLMLLDLDLPGLDGFQILENLRRDEELKRLPVVVLTSSVFSPDVKRAYGLGANSFLMKPTLGTELEEMLRATLDFWLGTCELPVAEKPKLVRLPEDFSPPEIGAESG